MFEDKIKIYLSILFMYFKCKMCISARILITSGMPKENGQNTEIIDLINPDFKCEQKANIPVRSAAVGGLLQNQPLICGGKDDAWNCFQVILFLK